MYSRTISHPRTSTALTHDRRYSEDEVARILEAATEEGGAGDRSLPQGDGPPHGDGVTLAELQDIGREVGIPEESIELAASRLGSTAVSPATKFLGRPIGVGRTVYLDRPVSDREWAIFVADLRETFDAQGRLRQEGAFREWTNGNLQALLEPTESGERLRLRTAKGGAKASFLMGATLLTLGAALLWGSAPSGGVSVRGLVGLVTILGGLFSGSRWLRLPKWAATRERQMEEVSDRLVAAVSAADRDGRDTERLT